MGAEEQKRPERFRICGGAKIDSPNFGDWARCSKTIINENTPV